MIKLKDILNESNYKPNEPIGKVMTDKDHPPFMTEEQWMEKWSRDELDEGFLDDTNKWAKKIYMRYFEKTLRFGQPPHDKSKIELMRKYIHTGTISSSDVAILKKFIRSHVFAQSYIAALIAFPLIGVLGAGLIGAVLYLWHRQWGIEWLLPNPDSNDYIDKAAAEKYKDYDEKDWSNKVLKLGNKHYTKTRDKSIKWLDKNLSGGKVAIAANDKLRKFMQKL